MTSTEGVGRVVGQIVVVTQFPVARASCTCTVTAKMAVPHQNESLLPIQGFRTRILALEGSPKRLQPIQGSGRGSLPCEIPARPQPPATRDPSITAGNVGGRLAVPFRRAVGPWVGQALPLHHLGAAKWGVRAHGHAPLQS